MTDKTKIEALKEPDAILTHTENVNLPKAEMSKLATELLICIETIEALGLASKDSLSMRHARRTLEQLTNGDGEWYER